VKIAREMWGNNEVNNNKNNNIQSQRLLMIIIIIKVDITIQYHAVACLSIYLVESNWLFVHKHIREP
jgi:hypothetical protein